ncbi:MAG TPA: hypothetical protein VFE45_02980 [Coriobacteriia bacterium]|nr:hypothetical protein [Coriobacteriia bacterium]
MPTSGRTVRETEDVHNPPLPQNLADELLNPSVILSFSGLCLCLVRPQGSAVGWWMGQLDADDGSIACWGDYGPDLEDAIRAL